MNNENRGSNRRLSSSFYKDNPYEKIETDET
jgi:hypothetical protein